MSRMFPLGLIVVVILAGSTAGQSKSRDVTVDDYFTLATITDLAVSPDAKFVAYTEARWQKSSNDRKSDLWVVASDGKTKPRRLTNERANDRHPRWAADGKSIFVLGNRKRAAESKPPYDGSTQVWQIFTTGEPKPVTSVEGGVIGFDVARRGNALFYSVDTSVTDDDDFTELHSTFGKLHYGHGKRTVSEVFRLDLSSWRAEKVIAEKRYVRELAVSPDGERVAMITAPDDTVITSEGRSKVDVWDRDTGKVTGTDESWRKTAASPWPWLESLAWNAAGDRLAYVTIFDAYPAEVILNHWPNSLGIQSGGLGTAPQARFGKPVATRMKRPTGVHVHGYGSPLRWSGNHVLYLGEASGFVSVLKHDVKSSDAVAPTVEPGAVAMAFDVSRGNLVQLRATPHAMADLYNAAGRKLTDVNPQVASWKLPGVSHVTWTAPDGTKVGGVLELPPDSKVSKKLPLIVGIHGGPTTSVKANLEFNPYDGRLLFAARGYAVLCPNYRGSTGYGDKFTTDLIGNENDVDVKDILAGIQHLIKEGIVDPERIAVMGWSNGGYLTNCLITLKDPPVKIRAASSGAGILDCVAEWGFNDEPAYPRVFKKGLPWETPAIYHKTSPTYGLGNVKTPTLIHVGENDVRCPPGHSRMLYRALKEYVHVPTQLIVYPGEPHGLGRYSHRQAKMEWDLAWFDRYVLDKKGSNKP